MYIKENVILDDVFYSDTFIKFVVWKILNMFTFIFNFICFVTYITIVINFFVQNFFFKTCLLLKQVSLFSFT